MVTLTIAIPTYNRKQNLTGVLEKLSSSPMPFDVEVLILDNNSVEPVRNYAEKIFIENKWNARFIRNETNVGLAANMMKAFELSKGDWIWTLGDDDLPLVGAIDLIFQEIKKYDSNQNISVIKFSSSAGGVESDCELNDLQAFATHCSNYNTFSNMLFMSTSIYKSSMLKNYFAVGYHWAYSVGPQLAMMIAMARDGHSFAMVSKRIVINNVPDEANRWNRMRLIMGIATLGEIENCEIFNKLSIQPYFYLSLDGGFKWLIRIHGPCLRDASRGRSYWRMYYFRMAGCFDGWKCLYLLISGLIVPVIAKNRVVKLVIGKIKGLENTNANIDRT